MSNGESLAAELARIEQLLRSEPAAALLRVRGILRVAPGHPMATLYLGIALRGTGAVESAADTLRTLADAQPGWALACCELGLTLSELGQHAAAVVALRRAVALQPDASEAWRALGDALAAAGDQTGASAAYDNQVRTSIREPCREAAVPVDGRIPQAEALLRAYLMRFPTDVAAIRTLAEVSVRQGRIAYAEKLLARCLEFAPDLAAARFSYALVLQRLNRPEAALEQLRILLQVEPMNLSYRNLQAVVLTTVGEYAQAVGIFAEILAAFPTRARIWLSQGHALSAMGRTAEGIAAYRQCIRLLPGYGEAYWSLANLKTFRFSAQELQAMHAQLERGDLTAEDRIHLEFALGKAQEDAGQYAASFAHYRQGNRLRRSGIAYSAEETHALVARQRDLYSTEFFRRRSGHGAPARDPIFVVGMPRSGSTLIEQILASHPAVEGTMELPHIALMARGLGARNAGTVGYPEVLAELDAAACRELGQRYLEETRIQRREARPNFIDKMPDNFLHVGLIHLVLPNARIVDARRHPMACCFSVFKQLFARGEPYAYDLEELGRYYRDYIELMAHMDLALPGRIHRVCYEQLVDDTELEVRRLLDYCGLPFDASCLRFHENQRAVRTASAQQVRQPIFRSGLDQWRHYAGWLEPLRQALGPVVDDYPHGDGTGARCGART